MPMNWLLLPPPPFPPPFPLTDAMPWLTEPPLRPLTSSRPTLMAVDWYWGEYDGNVKTRHPTFWNPAQLAYVPSAQSESFRSPYHSPP